LILRAPADTLPIPLTLPNKSLFRVRGPGSDPCSFAFIRGLASVFIRNFFSSVTA